MKVEDCMNCDAFLSTKREKEGIGDRPIRQYLCTEIITREGNYQKIHRIKTCPRKEKSK